MIACCDGLKGLPEAITNTWPLADVQQCVVHLVRNSLTYSSRKYWGQITKELKEIYTAPHRGRSRNTLRRVRRTVGIPVSGHDRDMAEQLGTIHAVPQVPGT